MTHINSDYLQNTLKNVLTYDKEIWQDSPLNSNTSPKNGNFGDRRFSLDFKKMIKNTPESLPHPFFQKKIKNCKIRSPVKNFLVTIY